MLLKLNMEYSSKNGLQSLKTSVLSALKSMEARLKNCAIMNVGLILAYLFSYQGRGHFEMSSLTK